MTPSFTAALTWLVGSYAQQVVDRQVFYPDWGGIGDAGPTQNIVPGDSKFAGRPFDIGHDQGAEAQGSDGEMSDGNESSDTEDVSMKLSPHRGRWTRVSDTCIK